MGDVTRNIRNDDCCAKSNMNVRTIFSPIFGLRVFLISFKSLQHVAAQVALTIFRALSYSVTIFNIV